MWSKITDVAQLDAFDSPTPPQTVGKLSARAAVSQGSTGLEITAKLSSEAAVRLHANTHTFQPVSICWSPVTNITGWHLETMGIRGLAMLEDRGEDQGV